MRFFPEGAEHCLAPDGLDSNEEHYLVQVGVGLEEGIQQHNGQDMMQTVVQWPI